MEPEPLYDNETTPVPPSPGALQAYLNQPWRVSAACRGQAPRAIGGTTDERHPWFPEWGETQRPAKEICWGCPVRVDCLEFAMESEEHYGIWGGLSRKERFYCKLLMGEGVPLVVAMIQAQSYRAIKRVLGIEPLEELDLEFEPKDWED